MRLPGLRQGHPDVANNNRTRAIDLRRRRPLYAFLAIYLGALVALLALGVWQLLR